MKCKPVGPKKPRSPEGGSEENRISEFQPKVSQNSAILTILTILDIPVIEQIPGNETIGDTPGGGKFIE